MAISKPIIERYGEDIRLSVRRDRIISAVQRYYADPGRLGSRYDLYYALDDLLADSESMRVALYIPFNLMREAPSHFIEAYTTAWHKLLDIWDVRENFHLGDTLEKDARPSDLLRVVKCAHLTPWLLKYGFITASDIENLLDKYKDDTILLQSFRDTWDCIRDMGVLEEHELKALVDRTSLVQEWHRPVPLYNSETRRKWLEEMDAPLGILATPDAKLEGPFYPNLMDMCKKIEKTLAKDAVVLIGGSTLRGYATKDSDLDCWKDEDVKLGDPESAGIHLGSMWVAGGSEHDLDMLIQNTVLTYSHNNYRVQVLEKLESDLIQYRLLHKGYARYYGIREFETSKYQQMDGDCAFYDDRFREIALQLFAKYVALPE